MLRHAIRCLIWSWKCWMWHHININDKIKKTGTISDSKWYKGTELIIELYIPVVKYNFNAQVIRKNQKHLSIWHNHNKFWHIQFQGEVDKTVFINKHCVLWINKGLKYLMDSFFNNEDYNVHLIYYLEHSRYIFVHEGTFTLMWLINHSIAKAYTL